MALVLDGQLKDPSRGECFDLLAVEIPLPSRRREYKPCDGAKSDASSAQTAKARRKSKPVRSACAQCRRMKTKCSGNRPSCRLCSNRGSGCSWDVDNGLTRTAGLKKQLREAVRRSNDLHELVDAMRGGTDEVSSMLLAKLRIGVSLESLLTGIHFESSAIDAMVLEAQEEVVCAKLPSV
jgi:hypothetical protein